MKPTTNSAERARFALVAALYKQQLGELIRERREVLGLTQKELADRANVEEPQTVSRWERGLNSPTDLEAVARALDTTAADLLSHLRPVTHKERRRLVPGDVPTQLDRIEAKLDELLSRLPADELHTAFEEGAEQPFSPPRRSVSTPKRKTPIRKAS